MNASLRQGLWLALAVVRAALGIGLALVVGAAVFALYTGPGAALGLRIAERVTAGMISADGVEGSLWGPLKVARLRITLDAVDIEIDDAELDADLPQLARRRIDVATLRAARVTVTIKPTPPQAEPTPPQGALTQLPFALAVHDARVGALRIVSGGEAAPIAIDDIALAATWSGPRVVLERLAATTPWVGRARLDGIAVLHPDAIELQPLHTDGFAVATLEGRFGYGTPSDLTLRWRKIAWPPAADAKSGGASEFASGGGEAHWRGLLDDYRFDVDGRLSLPRLPLSLSAEGKGSLSAVHLARLDAQALGGTLRAQADVAWREGLRIDGSGRVGGLQAEQYLPDLPGIVNGRFEAKTAIVGGRPDVSFTVQLENSKLRDYPLDAEARGHYAGDTLRFDVLKARSGRVALDAQGQVLPTLDAQARIDAQDLADAWPGLAGSLRGELRARGPLPGAGDFPQLVADLQATRLSYPGVHVSGARLKADIDPRRRLDLDLQLQDADVGATVHTATLAIHGPADAHDIRIDVDGEPARIELAAHGALDIEHLAWRGTIASGRVAPAELAPWTLQQPVPLAADAQDVTLEPMCWSSGEARACAGIKRNGPVRRIDFALSDFSLAYLQPLLGGANVDVVLQASGFAELGAQGLLDLRLDASTGGGRWQLGGLPPIALQPARLAIDDEGAAGTRLDLELPFAGGAVRGAATLAAGPVFMQRALSGTLDLSMPDLSWLRQVNTEVGRSAGAAQAHFQLEGTLGAPRLHGHLELRDGEVDLVTPGIALKKIGLRADADGDGNVQLDGEATSDSGTLRLSGAINPLVEPLKFDLKISGENFQAMKTSDARVWVSPDLHAALGEQRLVVDGTVLVPKAEITPKKLGDGSVSASGDQVLVGNDPGAQQRKDLRIDAKVTLKLGDDVRFEGFGLKSQLKGQVQAIEQPGVPTRANGEINLVDGKYKAYGQDLTIETGKLIFNGGPVTEPALEVRATRKPTDDVTVGLYVRGTLKKPEFKLFSTPTMPQQQQLAWLVLGHPLSDTASSDQKQMVGNAATSLGLAGGEWLASQLGAKIGIDEVTVGAKPGETNDQAMFTVGKYLSPKLFISYGIGLFQPGHTFRIQYDIGGGFKVRTETGVESGGDVLYSFERK
ncbi:translocation/assembly module TamB domain-containing protein [Solimonas soli]|uniref:translocation/assembly module TamB domain-containing protein n=1 Tax=Solimonas soli TaxID=413479 RepID=UPI00047F5EBB|nr:translocation/assembly module TamB domain-containing protein [Solimonas soli]